MEGRKQVGTSSSLASELFGSTETYPAAASSSSSSSSSTGIFGSIFGPPSNPKGVGKEFLHSENETKREFSSEPWSHRSGTADFTTKSREGRSLSSPNRDMNPIYQEQRAQPCHLSSSIYYGGQENYSYPQNSQSSTMNSVFKKDPGEDDSGTASRGNWWQGSLYY